MTGAYAGNAWPQADAVAENILLTSSPWPGGTGGHTGGAWQCLGICTTATNAWARKERSIRGDVSLSGVGVMAALSAAMPSFVAMLDKAARELDAAKAEASTTELSLLAPLKTPDAASQGRAAEIRSWFGSQDAATKNLSVEEAVGRLDVEFCRSLFDAPACMKLLAPDTRDRLGQMLLAQSDPRRFQAWQTLQAQIGVAEYALELATKRIQGSVQLGQEAATRRDRDEAMASRINAARDMVQGG